MKRTLPLIVPIALFISAACLVPSTFATIPPTLALAATDSGDNVQITVTGDPNVSVLLSYTVAGSGPQIYSLGTTNGSGSFTTVVSSATLNLTSGTLVTAILNGTGGPMSPTAPISQSSNKIIRLERRNHRDSFVEMEIESSVPFPVRDALPVLVAEGQPIAVGFIPSTGDTRHMIFRVEDANLAGLPEHFAVTIGHRGDRNGEQRDLGKLHKGNWPAVR